LATDEVIAATIEVPVADPVREDGARRFAEILGQLEPLLDTLLACAPHSHDRRPAVPHESGVYLFTEEDNHRYIGRAKDLNKRFGQHVAPKDLEDRAQRVVRQSHEAEFHCPDLLLGRGKKSLVEPRICFKEPRAFAGRPNRPPQRPSWPY
jgi:hypothetical protein